MIAKAATFSFLLSLFIPAVSFAQDTPERSMVIITTRAKGGPNLKAQVRKQIEKPLKKESKVVPYPAYKKAAKRAGIKGKAVDAQESVVEAGTEAGITHVLFIEGQMEKQQVGKKKKVNFALVTLIEVSSGDVVFTNRYELKGANINAVVAGTILDDLQKALTMLAEPPTPAEEPVAEESPPEPPAPPPPVDAPSAVENADAVAIAASADAELTPITEEPAPAPAPVEEPPVLANLTPSVMETSSISVSEPTMTRKRKRWRPALHVGIGGIALSRNAEITAKDATPPAYEGPLPGGFLRLSFFPMAIGGVGDVIEGLGIHGEAQYMRVETIVDEDTQEAVSSDIIGANGGLSFRIVFWDSRTAPDFVLNLGYGVFIFPLKQGAFPGTRYAGPYAGGTFTIPFIEELALLVGGHVTPLVTASGKLKRLGEQDGGLGFRAEGGLRLFIDPFEITAMGRFEQWSTAYTGSTTLEGVREPYQDVSFADTMFGGFVTAGVAF